MEKRWKLLRLIMAWISYSTDSGHAAKGAVLYGPDVLAGIWTGSSDPILIQL
jgi:hypothetical protein